MVESQQELDDNPYYDQIGDEDDDADLPAYLTNEYLDQCMLYQCEDPDRLSSSAQSSYSRPVSR